MLNCLSYVSFIVIFTLFFNVRPLLTVLALSVYETDSQHQNKTIYFDFHWQSVHIGYFYNISVVVWWHHESESVFSLKLFFPILQGKIRFLIQISKFSCQIYFLWNRYICLEVDIKFLLTFLPFSISVETLVKSIPSLRTFILFIKL